MNTEKSLDKTTKKRKKLIREKFSPITMDKSKGFWLILSIMVILFIAKIKVNI